MQRREIQRKYSIILKKQTISRVYKSLVIYLTCL
nr:MAG TPA: hypothetical protein [Caudoviricetes sp.]